MSTHPAMIPFVMNLRMERISTFINAIENNGGLAAYCDIIDVIDGIICQSRGDIKNIKTHHIAYDASLVQHLDILLGAALLKIRNNDIKGLSWCVEQMQNTIGYTPTPFVNIRPRHVISI